MKPVASSLPHPRFLVWDIKPQSDRTAVTNPAPARWNEVVQPSFAGQHPYVVGRTKSGQSVGWGAADSTQREGNKRGERAVAPSARRIDEPDP